MSDKMMKGITFLGNCELAYKDFPIPEPGPGQAVVKLKTAAICGSDLHFYKAEIGNPDVITGHEGAGYVHAVGAGVTNVKPGDRISIFHCISCGTCEHCLAGDYTLCSQRHGLGGKAHGTNAPYVLVDAINCMPLPEELSMDDGVFLGCIASSAYSAFRKLQMSSEDTLVIYGLGPVGLTAALLAKGYGCRFVGVEINEYRVKMARENGIEVINPGERDTYEALMEFSGGRGVDKAMETSGSNVLRKMAAKTAAIHGRIALVGLSGKIWNNDEESLCSFDERFVVRKELSILGSYTMPIHAYYPLVRFMVEKNIHFDGLVTHRFRPEQYEEAFKLFAEGSTGKVMFDYCD